MVSLYEEARTACRELGFRPRKGLGQHFLIHERMVETILRLADLSAEDEIIEVGPGMGFLTRRLLGVARRVCAVEVDPLLVGWLRRGPLGSHPGLDLVEGDVLDVDLGRLILGQKAKLVGNLPYSVSTPVLFRLFEEHRRFSLLVVMVQREVAERMAAAPGTKSYGTLSVWCRVYGQIVAKVPVPPHAFFPRPRVRSTVLKMVLHARPLIAPEDALPLRLLVRACFGQRRKMLTNALGQLANKGKGQVEELLKNEGIDPRRRGETLSVEELIRLVPGVKRLVDGSV